jgi:hypothetical protein
MNLLLWTALALLDCSAASLCVWMYSEYISLYLAKSP